MGHEKFFRCSCGANHFVTINSLDWGDGREWYLTVLDMDRAEALSLWHRLKAALKLAWGRNHTWTEILVTEQVAHEMISALQGSLRDAKSALTQTACN